MRAIFVTACECRGYVFLASKETQNPIIILMFTLDSETADLI